RRSIECLAAALGHRKRVVREVDALFFLVPLVEREVDAPRQSELVLLDETQLLDNAVAREPCEFVKVRRISGREKHRIAVLQSKLSFDGARSFGADVFGDGPRTAFLTFTPENIADARLALALRPRIHAVTEGARGAAPRRYRPAAPTRALCR